MECKCMEFMAASCCTEKWLKLYQTMRNITFGDKGIPLVMIRQEVTGLEKTRLMYLLDLFEGRGKKGQCDLVCVEHLWIIVLMVVVLSSYSRVMSAVLVLSGVVLHALNFSALFSFRNSAKNN